MKNKERIYGGEISWLESSIMYHEINNNGLQSLDGINSELDKTKYNIDRMINMMQGNKVFLVTDLRSLKNNIPKVSRDYSEKMLNPHLITCAVIMKSSLSRIFGNLLLSFNKKNGITIKLFSDVDAALTWSRAQKEALVSSY
ncbi:MAG: hypothetical protein MK212_01040 [Saprospiraceae bacterium]|nr:hypothetical protein [Saprospiraceae bacterium]